MNDREQLPQPLYYQASPDLDRDEIDLFEILSSLLSRWQLILGISTAGMLACLLIAIFIPKTLETTASVRQPFGTQIASINKNGFTQFKAPALFKRYYDEVKSRENLKQYLVATNPFPALDSGFDPENLVATATAFAEDFEFTVLEPEVPKGEVVKFPELFQVSVRANKDAEVAGIIDGYLEQTGKNTIEEIRTAGIRDVALQTKIINRDIELLRSNAKFSRELQIEKIQIQNREAIDILEQQVRLLENKAAKQRQNRITKLEEESDTAKVLNISAPVTLEMLAHNTASSNVSDGAATQVNISNSANRMEFLMGTQYLDNQVKLLKSRSSDRPHISEIPELLRKIAALKNDKKIAALKARKSDDAFIKGFPAKINALNKLKQISFQFEDAVLYRTDKTAAADESSQKPGGMLIVILGTILSGMLAIFIALIVSAFQKRGMKLQHLT